MFREGISIGRKRCLYLRRWTSRTSSGKRSSASFLDLSGNARRQRAVGRGAIRATSFTAFSGSCAPAPHGQTCRRDIRRTRLAFVASRSGRPKACSIAYSQRSRAIFTSAGRSTSPKHSSTAATPAQKKGPSCWQNSTRQSDQDHGSGRPPWSSYRRVDCEWRAP